MTRTIIVLLEYKDNEEWFGRELLSDGKILYACNDIIKLMSYREKEPESLSLLERERVFGTFPYKEFPLWVS